MRYFITQWTIQSSDEELIATGQKASPNGLVNKFLVSANPNKYKRVLLYATEGAAKRAIKTSYLEGMDVKPVSVIVNG